MPPTTEPTPAATAAINPLIASISSNEAKILALERRMAGHDSSRLESTSGVGALTSCPTSFPQLPSGTFPLADQSQGAAAVSGRRHLVGAVSGTLPGPLVTADVPPAPAATVSDIFKRRRTGVSPGDGIAGVTAAADVATAGPATRPPLSDITPDKDKDRPASALRMPATTPGLPRAQTPPQPGAPGTGALGGAPGSGPPTAAFAGSAGGGGGQGDGSGGGAGATAGGGSRSRKRKQQDPRHDRKSCSGGGPAGAAGRGGGAAVVAAATAVASGATTPSRARAPGGADPTAPSSPIDLTGATAVPASGSLTPRGTASRHLFGDSAGGGRCHSNGGAAGGGGGRATSCVNGGGGGRHGSVAAASAPGVGPMPPSATKRGILSYYPPVLAAGSGASGHCPTAMPSSGFVSPDQSSRDGLPAATPSATPPPQAHSGQGAPSLLQQAASGRLAQQVQQLQHLASGSGSGTATTAATGAEQLQQQQQPRAQQAQHVGAAAAAVAPASDVASGDSTAAAQLQQYQQQVAQLQSQVIQVQAAMATQQSAAGAEIERLRRELEERLAEAASLRDRCRSAEAALQQAAAGEAAARAALEALQASSASDSARWATEAAEASRVAAEREARFQSELAKAVQISARLERELSRSQLSANAARLGSLTLVRTGPMQMAEVWEDGTAFQQIAARRAALTAAREEVTAAQKFLRKRLAPPPGGARSAASSAAATSHLLGVSAGEESSMGGYGSGTIDMPYMSGQEFVAADEVYKTRLAVLKREDENLKEEEERLNREKLKQIRFVKLSREEDCSRFGRWPVLPDRPGPEGRSRYVLMNLLGKGGFSEVFKAYDLFEARHVCVKIHALTSSWPAAKKENYVRHAIREYDIHRSLRHSAVVALLDVLEIDLDTFATVLELCEGGDLDTMMREHGTLPEREARCLMTQIFGGLRYLATRRVIHYDLKPANILFDNLGQAKITDFGLSKLVSEGQTLAGIELTSQGAGTYWYLPPEAFETGGQGPPRISNKVDVWSAGVIFYSLLFGKKPYGESMSQEQMLRERVMAVPREVDFPAGPAVSAEAKDFIRRCLAWRQDSRPDVESAARDPYLTGGPSAAAAAAGAGGGAGAGAASRGFGLTSSLGLGLAAVVGSRR